MIPISSGRDLHVEGLDRAPVVDGLAAEIDERRRVGARQKTDES